MNKSEKEARLKQAEKYARLGRLPAAIEEYRKVIDADAADAALINLVGDLCVRAGMNDRAIAYFMRVARAYVAAGDAKAAGTYKKVLKLDPGNVEVLVALGDLYLQQERAVDACQQYVAAAQLMREAGHVQKWLRLFKKACDADPENVALRLELATSYHNKGFPHDAHDAYVAAGKELLRRNRTAEAVTALRQALAIKPASKTALNALAECYLKIAEPGLAIEALCRAIEFESNDTDLLVILGRTYLAAGHLDEARETLARVYELEPVRYDYMLEVARHYVASGEYDKPIDILDGFLDLLLQRRQKKKATALLKDIIRANPDHIRALQRLASVYAQVAERKNLVTTLNSLAEAAIRQGRRDVAIEALMQLAELEPARKSHKMHLATLRSCSFEIGDDGDTAEVDLTRDLTLYAGEPSVAAHGDQRVKEAEELLASHDYSTELLEEMVAQHPEFVQARLKMMEELVASQPRYLEGRLKLKQLYLESGMADKAAAQCVELASIYEERGETDIAEDYLEEAYQLDPHLEKGRAGVAPDDESEDPSDGQIHVRYDELFDHAVLARSLDAEWRRSIRGRNPVAFVCMALDGLDECRITCGAARATWCLDRVASAVENVLDRPGALLGRGDGDTLALLLPATDRDEATRVAERLRALIEELGLAPAPDGSGPITLSIGAAVATPSAETPARSIAEAAERALGHARGSGGNRVVVG